jgi:hypothetical protein
MTNVRKRIFYRACEKAGLHRRPLHSTRHTFATLLLQQGESPVYVKEQMGHSSITVTVDTYKHWIPSANRDAVNRLPSLINLSQNLRGGLAAPSHRSTTMFLSKKSHCIRSYASEIYGVPRNVSGTRSKNTRPFVVQLCSAFFGLKDEAFSSKVLEDQENS